MTEVTIAQILYTHWLGSHKAVVRNVYMHWGECDVLSINKNKYLYEFEIKISKSDLKNESKKLTKAKKHRLIDIGQGPNYFYFVVPEGLIDRGDIVPWPNAGLIYVGQFGRVKIVKRAKRIHDREADPNTLIKIAQSLSYRFYEAFVNGKLPGWTTKRVT